ncbi:Os11g0136300 [Oryza sativa Japonica Group]|uniref:WAT1-related protein n=1 Tax=Oryza sativa subsp. japonica TaxID=39947 RepID=Q0IUT2_ORYSJ|nr:Os11g0136300 [Oryza sativa Japonica Group]|eukprot:NP_001065688.2 Os11g0136300 [Oryza sativa Japonica Group]
MKAGEKYTTRHDTWGAHKALLLCLNRDYAWGKSVPCKSQVHLCNSGICSKQLTPSHHLLLGGAFEDGVCEAEELFRHTKVTSVAICLAGVFTIAFFTGPSISPINHHRAFASDTSSKTVVPRGVWIKWTFLMVVANMCWSLWIIFQAAVQKEYPDKMVVTVTQCLFSTVQSFVVAVVAERDFSRWKLRFDISLLAILYSGVMVTGVSYYLQTWCLEMRGPMFFASWTPLCFVFTIFCSSFFLGEIVHLGSILGGILLVGSLYTMLWGKSKEDLRCTPSTSERCRAPRVFRYWVRPFLVGRPMHLVVGTGGYTLHS